MNYLYATQLKAEAGKQEEGKEPGDTRDVHYCAFHISII